MNRLVFCALAIAVCVFSFISLLSFEVTDWPNPDVVSNQPIENLCGRTGAYVAYQSNYYLGPAGIGLLVMITIWLVLACMNKPVEQLVLRSIGVLLLAAVISGSAYLIKPGGVNSLSHGNGGILGIAVGHFLLSNTALIGAILILTAGLIVGLLLAMDNVIVLLPQLLLQGMERIRQAGPIVATVGEHTRSRLAVKSAAATAILAPPPKSLPRGSADLELPPEKPSDNTADDSELFNSNKKDAQDNSQKGQGNEEEDQPPTEPRKTSLEAVSSALAMLRGNNPLKSPASASATVNQDFRDYVYPPLALLEEPVKGYSVLQEKIVAEKAQILERTLKEFNINATVVDWETGPVITMFELSLAPGIKVSQISNLSNDLARSLGAAAVRVVAPIPGKHTIGIEAPNSEKEKVRIKELLGASGKKLKKMAIPLFLGKDASGEPLVVDLAGMPHCLIAGTTGSGKSVCINSIIMSIMLTQRPDMVKMILVDPKMVEMNAFRDVAHLMCPIVTEMKRAEQILEWLTIKMDERYALLAEARVRNIAGYNALTEEQIYERFSPSCEEEKEKIPLRLPYLVIVIDELADLMMTSAKEVEGYIIRLAQKSRAVGIHIVLATQRPQATVVTGLIKSNLPSRISFRVAARMDSRIVLDQNGAEALLGQGDMLFLQPGTSDLIRAQGTYISDEEINSVVQHLKEFAQPSFHPELVQLNQFDASDMERDELFDEAVRMVLQTKRGSVSLLQRRLTVGYSRASRLIDQMAMAGIVGEYKGSQAREVLITPEEYEVIRKQMALDDAAGFSDLQDDEAEPDSGPSSTGTPIKDAPVVGATTESVKKTVVPASLKSPAADIEDDSEEESIDEEPEAEKPNPEDLDEPLQEEKEDLGKEVEEEQEDEEDEDESEEELEEQEDAEYEGDDEGEDQEYEEVEEEEPVGKGGKGAGRAKYGFS